MSELHDADLVPPAADRPAGSPKTSKRSTKLPWALAAIGLVTSLALTVVTVAQGQQISQLKDELAAASASPTAEAPTAEPSAPAEKPLQTPDADARQLLESLPRRNANDPTAIGRVDAPVVMIEWSDYRCPYCAVFAQSTHHDLKRFVNDGTLRIEHRDRIMFGEMSHLAAVAARAAGLQGKYWEFYEALFAITPTQGHMDVTTETVIGVAKKIGIPDLDQFAVDLSSAELKKAVDADDAEAQRLGISSTPFFILNDQVVPGAQPTERFVALIEQLKQR